MALFGATTHSILHSVTRRLTSKNGKGIQRFLSAIQSSSVDALRERLTSLAEATSWSPHHSEQLEEADQQFTALLLHTESQASVPTTPWSPQLHEAHLIYSYWCIARSAQLNHRNARSQLEDIQSQLPPGSVFQNNIARSILRQKQLARRTLIDVQLHARTHRDKFLQINQEKQIDEGNPTIASAISQLRTQERRQRCWNTIRTLTKPRSAGGISHVLIPILDKTGQEIGRRPIHDKIQMDTTLFHRYQTHFAQADGTPFTRPPDIYSITLRRLFRHRRHHSGWRPYSRLIRRLRYSSPPTTTSLPPPNPRHGRFRRNVLRLPTMA
jgi:hypothetical protein